MGNKLSIHLSEEDKTKPIPFASKLKKKKIKKLRLENIGICRSNSILSCLGCLMDEAMPRKVMEINVIHKINNKLKFIYRKNVF